MGDEFIKTKRAKSEKKMIEKDSMVTRNYRTLVVLVRVVAVALQSMLCVWGSVAEEAVGD